MAHITTADRRPDMRGVEVVTSSELVVASPVTPGMDRRRAFHDDAAWVGTVRTEPGVLTGWHSHPGYDTYIGVTSGQAVVEFGPGGAESLTAGPGDVIRIGRGVVHREGTAVGSNGVEAMLFRVGDGDVVLNADGPDPA
jgi:quercetin dioxygenase-like cupin family protein